MSLKIYKSIPYQCRIFIVRAIESFHVEHHLYQPFRDYIVALIMCFIPFIGLKPSVVFFLKQFLFFNV